MIRCGWSWRLHAEQFLGIPVLRPAAQIEPQSIDAAIPGQDFSDLPVKIGDVAGLVLRLIVGMVPVGLRVVDDQLQPKVMTGIGNILENVVLPGRLGPGAPVLRELTIEEAKAVVVLDQEDEVTGPGLLGQCDPLSGVKSLRFPFLVEVVVDRGRGRPLAALLLVSPGLAPGPANLQSGQTDGSPAEKHAEPVILPGLHHLRPRTQ